MEAPASENSTKTVLELDLASYSDISRFLEENLDVYAVKHFQDQIQSFVDCGLEQVGRKREEVVLGTAGDNALLVFEDAAVMHRFAEAMQRAVASHNREKTVDFAKRCFRMGAATGPVLLLQAERRIVGTTVARAVRLEAAAKIGQLLVDVATYDRVRRCTFVPAPPPAQLPLGPKVLRWAATVAFMLLLCGTVATVVISYLVRKDDLTTNVPNTQPLSIDGSSSDKGLNLELWQKDRDRAVAEWVLLNGGRVKVNNEEIRSIQDLPKELFQLTHVGFEFGGHRITDHELAYFSGTNIIDLNLKKSNITDDGLATISDLHLEFLDVDGVRGITDIGAERLGRMRSLQYLYLKDTRISDIGLAHLLNLNELRELHVKGTDVTPDGLDRLKKALPNLRDVEY
jgi:class 3 adenylate cyclase